ncbi:GlxA family transcriptional regulator [Haliangium sp.]|uniref:GlxA family transcriptional regulator n=1 Tax=Haliangium sp. TaxID=2663208 RepID=UPI003D0DA229
MFAGFRPPPVSSREVPHKLAVVAFDGVVLADLAGACEMFERVRGDDGRERYQVRVCAPADEIQTRHAALRPPWRLASVGRADTVIVPGVDDLDRPLPGPLLSAIRRAAARGARVASICTGAFVLAAAGLLDGRRATTHWAAAAALAHRYPAIDVDPNVLFVDGGDVLTSAGAAAGLDLCLHMIRRDLGARVAAAVARTAVMPLERAGGQAQFIVHEPPSNDSATLAPVLAWLERNLRRDLSVPAIARRAAMSPRTLSRRFREQLGITPAQWVITARVRRAQHLLESTALSIERVATEVGFGSATVLREHFAKVVGTSPVAYRQAFRTG